MALTFLGEVSADTRTRNATKEHPVPDPKDNYPGWPRVSPAPWKPKLCGGISPESDQGDRSKVRRRIAERDGGHFCSYCSVPLFDAWRLTGGVFVRHYPYRGWYTLPGFYVPHLDHVFPRHLGGSNSDSNTVLACAPCNGRKGKRTIDEWVEKLGQGTDLVAA